MYDVWLQNTNVNKVVTIGFIRTIKLSMYLFRSYYPSCDLSR